MSTYFYFVLGYILFWLLPFIFIGALLIKTRKLEQKLNSLEKDQ